MVFFAEVAERGGFAAASRALGIPKSRLSRRVADLEERLGVQLMQRSTRRLSLTPAGEIYLRHSAAMRDAAQAAAEAVAQVQTEPSGTVRLSCPISIAHSGLGRLLPRFMERYPAVRVDLRVMNRPVDLIEEGIDIALRVRPAIEDSTTLVAKVLGTSRAVLVIRPDLLARQGPVDTPADLVRLQTAAMSANSEGRSEWRLEGPNGEIHVHVHTPRYIADDLATLQLAVLEGAGATLLPGYMCREDVEAGRLARVLPDWGPAAVIAHMVFPARRALVPAVRRLIDFLAEHLHGNESGMY
jgi:DNA-binding transcriptional LysR family regulator